LFTLISSRENPCDLSSPYSSHEYHSTSLSLHNAKRLDRLSISRRLVLLDGLDLGLLLVSRDRRLGNFLLFLVVGVYVLAWAVEVGLVEDWKGDHEGTYSRLLTIFCSRDCSGAMGSWAESSVDFSPVDAETAWPSYTTGSVLIISVVVVSLTSFVLSGFSESDLTASATSVVAWFKDVDSKAFSIYRKSQVSCYQTRTA
jgi:hypothetical protein